MYAYTVLFQVFSTTHPHYLTANLLTSELTEPVRLPALEYPGCNPEDNEIIHIAVGHSVEQFIQAVLAVSEESEKKK